KRLMKQLREFAQEHPGITIILATHSIEMLRAFGFKHKEKGLRKGGEIIEENIVGQETDPGEDEQHPEWSIVERSAVGRKNAQGVI
ncbi:MAG: hypothetical protein WBM35_17535, partial [Candidatus Electrothrix sp.]